MREGVGPWPAAGRPGPAVTLRSSLGSTQSGFLQKWGRARRTARTSASPRAVKDTEPQPCPSPLAAADRAAASEDGWAVPREAQRSVTVREMPFEMTRSTRCRVTRDGRHREGVFAQREREHCGITQVGRARRPRGGGGRLGPNVTAGSAARGSRRPW